MHLQSHGFELQARFYLKRKSSNRSNCRQETVNPNVIKHVSVACVELHRLGPSLKLSEAFQNAFQKPIWKAFWKASESLN